MTTAFIHARLCALLLFAGAALVQAQTAQAQTAQAQTAQAQTAQAQTAPVAQPLPLPPSYAVISEVARELSVVSFQESTGSRLNQNQRQRLPVADGALDKVALLTTQQAIKAAAPAAAVWLLAPSDSDFFDALQSFTVGDLVKMPADLAAAVKENRSTHLLLLSRYRSEAEFRFVETTEVSGALEGLGLFVERRSRVTNLKTRESGTGFLAPYVYLRATLIDTTTARVLNTRTTKATRIYSAGEAKDGSGNPWEALTSAEKMTTLRDMLIQEVKQLVPLVLAAP